MKKSIRLTLSNVNLTFWDKSAPEKLAAKAMFPKHGLTLLSVINL